ncbi:MAG: NADH-quinone oxidoreductase subunit C [Bacteroidota bacterium]
MSETLKFHFTPVDPPRADRDENPHAKSTTRVPEVVEALKSAFGEAIRQVDIYAGETTVLVATDRIVEICRYLKDEQDFDYLSDLAAVDRFTEEERFEVFYSLLDMEGRKRIRLKVRCEEDDPTVPSITAVHRAANWNEREAFDMMGIRFDGHEDMRRMFLPEDFEYFPQRKEFPLLGIPGSLPLPPRTPEGELTMDPFAAARQGPTIKSYEEPGSPEYADED